MPAFTFRPTGRLAAGLLALLSVAPAAAAQSAPPRADSARIRADVAYLADDRLEGRLTGTPGNDSAAAYIARRFQALGLRPVVEGGYLQKFTTRDPHDVHAGNGKELRTQNVVAVIPGRDPKLRGQYVVLGAHFDHLGRETRYANDPKAGDAIRNGADDNASGTAAVMELARLLAARPAKRSVVVVAFSGEEEGTLGSGWFVAHPPVPLDSVVAMLNFDMVGRLKNDRLLVYGVGTATELPALVDSANARPKLSIKTLPDGVGPSDHTSFYLKDLPVLHFFTDVHGDYHAATDDVERINAAGEARVVDLAHAITRTIADRTTRLTFTRTATTAMAPSGPSSGAPRPYFGSIPDMGADAAGLRVGGVSPGSPADKAGVKAGDVVVKFGDAEVRDLQSYSDALYAHKPGDTVTLVVMRNGERVTLTATLTRRGE